LPDSDDDEGNVAGDRSGGALRHTYDWDATRPSTAVVELVSIAADRAPVSLEPLFGTVDPDALDTLVDHDGDARPGVDTTVSIRYAGFDVSVRWDGEVAVTPAPDDADDR
jgi:YD repeat-containing protein